MLKFILLISVVFLTSCGLDSSNRNQIYRCRYQYSLEHCVTRDIDTVSFVNTCNCTLYIESRAEAVPVVIVLKDSDNDYYNNERLYYNYCNYWFIKKDTI
jgi:hypothetical protein